MDSPGISLADAFDRAMQRLGPFEACPAVAVALSGGADSTALALLADSWVRKRQGHLIALIVDHGLRVESGEQARTTADRMRALGVAARILPLTSLGHGPALAERARIARYAALEAGCRTVGCLHLLLGHHAADQAETLAMRVLRGSREDGLAGMAALWETPFVRLLRPLLGLGPVALRQLLIERGIAWFEDPANHDRRALRSRLREGFGADSAAVLADPIAAAGRRRALAERATAVRLSHHVSIRPEGFAQVTGRLHAADWSGLLRTIGAARYPPDPDRVADLASSPRPMTLGGARVGLAGRLGDGLLVMREEAAVQEPVAAVADTLWDRRFRLIFPGGPPDGATIGKLGTQAALFRRVSDLPACILRTLPVLRFGKVLAAVPHLGFARAEDVWRMNPLFSPPAAAAGAEFLQMDTQI